MKIKSKRKIPAIERYDGYFFKILKKNRTKNLGVLILSAKYGLLNEDEKISYYDKKMNHDTAKQLENQVSKKFLEKVNLEEYEEVCINLGRCYTECFAKTIKYIKRYFSGRIFLMKGGLGNRGNILKNWLNT